jgi:hypothetical protein
MSVVEGGGALCECCRDPQMVNELGVRSSMGVDSCASSNVAWLARQIFPVASFSKIIFSWIPHIQVNGLR